MKPRKPTRRTPWTYASRDFVGAKGGDVRPSWRFVDPRTWHWLGLIQVGLAICLIFFFVRFEYPALKDIREDLRQGSIDRAWRNLYSPNSGRSARTDALELLLANTEHAHMAFDCEEFGGTPDDPFDGLCREGAEFDDLSLNGQTISRNLSLADATIWDLRLSGDFGAGAIFDSPEWGGLSDVRLYGLELAEAGVENIFIKNAKIYSPLIMHGGFKNIRFKDSDLRSVALVGEIADLPRFSTSRLNVLNLRHAKLFESYWIDEVHLIRRDQDLIDPWNRVKSVILGSSDYSFWPENSDFFAESLIYFSDDQPTNLPRDLAEQVYRCDPLILVEPAEVFNADQLIANRVRQSELRIDSFSQPQRVEGSSYISLRVEFLAGESGEVITVRINCGLDTSSQIFRSGYYNPFLGPEWLCCTKEALGKSSPFPVYFSLRAAWSAFRAG